MLVRIQAKDYTSETFEVKENYLEFCLKLMEHYHLTMDDNAMDNAKGETIGFHFNDVTVYVDWKIDKVDFDTVVESIELANVGADEEEEDEH